MMSRVLFLLMFCCVYIVADVQAASVAARLDTAKLDRFFDTLEQNQRLMGSVSVTRNGTVLYTRAFGFREQKDGATVASDDRTMYRVGSITKVFTAVMIYQLIDEKRLALDTKLSRFFPRIANADRITIAHLLCHCSGIPSFPQNADYSNPKEWVYQPQTGAQMLARFEAMQPEYAPGEQSTYSNTNYVLLGKIIESVTRSTYAEQLRKRITRRIGLKRTRYGGAIDPEHNEARSFTWDEGKWTPSPEEHSSVAAAAGAILSTPSDLTQFIRAVATNRLMSAAGVQEMLTPFSEKLQGSEKGISVFTLRGVDKKAFQHLGGIDGFMSNVTYLPEDGVAVAISVNGFNYPINKIFRTVIDTLYDRPAALPSFVPVELPAETLAGYEGVYALQGTDLTFTIAAAGRQLTAQLNGQDAFPIVAIGETMFTHEPSGILIEFQRDASGATGSLAFNQGRSEGRFTRTPTAAPLP